MARKEYRLYPGDNRAYEVFKQELYFNNITLAEVWEIDGREAGGEIGRPLGDFCRSPRIRFGLEGGIGIDEEKEMEEREIRR